MSQFKSLALGLAALLAVSTAGGLVYAHDKRGGDRGHHTMRDGKPGHGKYAKGHGCERHGMKHGMRSGMHRHFKPDPNRMARELSVMETAIGIRAEQLDTWRDFTDALLAMTKPPRRDGAPAKLGEREPFSMAEKFADRSLDRAEAAKRLKDAVDKLRQTLTSEQLEQVRAYEDSIHARMRGHGWGHRGHGMWHGKKDRADGAKWGDQESRDKSEAKPSGDDAEMDAPADDDAEDNAEDNSSEENAPAGQDL